jgi:hypothetical protein
MAVYCISSTLINKNYDKLHEVIKSYNNWWHNSDSVWFIETTESASTILEKLKVHLISGDKLIVIEVKQHWWAVGYKEEEYNWLKQKTFL